MFVGKVCKKCKRKIKEMRYETGIEEYCGCQCTLDADWDPSYWEDDE